MFIGMVRQRLDFDYPFLKSHLSANVFGALKDMHVYQTPWFENGRFLSDLAACVKLQSDLINFVASSQISRNSTDFHRLSTSQNLPRFRRFPRKIDSLLTALGAAPAAAPRDPVAPQAPAPHFGASEVPAVPAALVVASIDHRIEVLQNKSLWKMVEASWLSWSWFMIWMDLTY
jgi:hypothetical protein